MGDDRWTTRLTSWPGSAGHRKVGRPLARRSDDIVKVAGINWMHTLAQGCLSGCFLQDIFRRVCSGAIRFGQTISFLPSNCQVPKESAPLRG
ncbi:jg16216 [Pararge aegeria aegeria]|uniref:Jg16216 protein n=1 Tax=Pararge aegeria aegeria TaxID=348720 RepID=A0A8S4RW81_9NEOP|nr:jg16216 [Pararge aegeria aegeria]